MMENDFAELEPAFKSFIPEDWEVCPVLWKDFKEDMNKGSALKFEGLGIIYPITNKSLTYIRPDGKSFILEAQNPEASLLDNLISLSEATLYIEEKQELSERQRRFKR